MMSPSRQQTLESFLSDPLLDAEAIADFHRQCERIAARHAGWRRNFPAFAVLLDTEEGRAHALAGNYATEGRETVGAWLVFQEGQGDDWARRRSIEELRGWIEGYLSAWREQVLLTPDFAGLAGAARERFLLILDDLLERGREETVEHVRQAAASPRASKRRFVPLRPFAAIGRAVWRFFDPTLGEGR